MSLAISRTALRQSAKLPSRVARRFESSTTTGKAADAAKDAASKASATAASFQSKASEGLSRVTSSAGPAISSAASKMGSALGKIGGRTGRLIAFIERGIPPTLYYARVGLELGKLVFKGQNMTPPPVSSFQPYMQQIVKSVQKPGQIVEAASKLQPKGGVMQSVRSMDRAQLAAGAVIAAELLGFFTVGEMIGRFKVVGYRGDTGAHH